MVSGRTVERAIKEFLDEQQAKVDTYNTLYSEAERQISGLEDQRERAYADLAAVYLPQLGAEQVQRTLADLRGQVRSIFDRRLQRRGMLDERIAQAGAERASLQDRLESETEELEKLGRQRADLTAKAAQLAEQDPAYVALREQTGKGQARLAANQERVKEAQENADEHLPAFESDRLFSYLLERKFGTDEYSASFITRPLDRWVAGKVDFTEQYKKYRYLKQMPGLMEKELASSQKQFDGLLAQVQRLERKAASEVGLDKLIDAIDEKAQERKGTIAQLADTDGKLAKYQSERTDADSERGSEYREAVGGIKKYLSGKTISALREQARLTPERDDDRLVEAIAGYEARAQVVRAEAKDARKSRDRLLPLIEGLRSLYADFRQNDFEASNSRFDGDFDITKLLTGYLLGRASLDNVWRQIESNQDFKHDDYDSGGFGGSSGGMFGGSSSGGGFGGFSSGGGISFGGFSSGKGF